MDDANDTDGDTSRRDSLVGQVLFDKLRVEAVLGRGGMGTVYRVTHLGTRHSRALKVLNPEIKLSDDALIRFQREATVSGVLKSPFVVETLDTGQLPDGSLYVLMELLDGVPLSGLVGGGAVLPLARIVPLLRQACRALELAHDQGIVHRDIKPENLFVVMSADGEERIKILDFGIARFRQPDDSFGSMTREHAVLGTPLYMAPEQIGSAHQADGRADVYALGIVLYEALSGRKPYEASTFAELVARIYEGTSTPLERTAPGLTPFAYDVVTRAMARRPEDRFQSVRELDAALAALETNVASSVRPAQDIALGQTAPSVIPPAARVPDFGLPRTHASVRPPSESGSTPSVAASAPGPSWVWPAGVALTLALIVGVLAFGQDTFVAGDLAAADAGVGAATLGAESHVTHGGTLDGGPPQAGASDDPAGAAHPDVRATDPASIHGGGGTSGGSTEVGPPRRGEGPRGTSSGGLAGPDEVYGGPE